MAILGAVLFAVCITPMVRAPWLIALYILPVLAISYVLRTGTDADGDGLLLRTLLRRSRISWADVRGLRVGRRGELFAVLDDGLLRLPGARQSDLPTLQAVSEAAAAEVIDPEAAR
jgi:hypothetical protein